MIKVDRTHLDRLLLNVEPALRSAFLRLIRETDKQVLLDDVALLLERGLIDDALSLLNGYLVRFTNSSDVAFTTVGAKILESLSSELSVVISFDQVNTRAVRLMQESKLRMLTGFTNEQRKATQLALTEGIRTGTNPRVQALRFLESVGLTESQLKSVYNYRTLLETNSLDALRRELRDARFDSRVRARTVLTERQINQMVTAYRRNLIRHRATVIARTEALRVVHQASQEAYLQAIEAGVVSQEELIQEWITARDERVRGSHSIMHGQKRAIGDYFISGDGHSLRYPGDPSAPASETIQCRCVLTTRIKGE